MNYKKYPVYYTFPNLSTIKQRGNVSIRWKRSREIEKKINQPFNFNLVEVPADFIKTSKEMRKTGLYQTYLRFVFSHFYYPALFTP